MYRSITTTPNNKRVFGACLLSFMILIAPMASVGAATRRLTAPPASTSTDAKATPAREATKSVSGQPGVIERLSAFLFGPPAPPVAPAITATMTDAYPVHPSTKAEPGDTISYSATIFNNGADPATGVMFDVPTLDANTSFVAGSLKVSPLAFPDAYTVLQDTELSHLAATGVLANDTGTAPLNAVPIAGGAPNTTEGGTVALNADGGFTYNPKTGFTGTDTFTYTVTNVQAPNDTATVTITVVPPDIPPTAVNDAATVNEDASATAINVLGNDTDPDGGPKNIASINQPTNGSVVGTGPSGAFTGLTYQPNPNYCNNPPGSPLDTFTYTLNGGSVGTVAVTVTCFNDAPTITDTKPAAVTMSEDGSPTPFSLTLNATDVEGDTITWSISSPATQGTATATGTGASKAIGYTPTANYNGSDSFTVQVSDGNGGTDTIIVNVTINSVNDAPTITNSKPAAVTMSEDGSPTPFSLTLNATDADVDTITWSISSAASNGTATASGTGASKAIGYTPTANYNGSDSFTVQVSDGNGGTDTIIVNVTINAVNDAPTITDTKPAAVTMSEDGSPTPFSLTLNATDVEANTLTWSISGPASNGTATASGTGNSKAIGYTPTANYNGPDSFTVQVSDGNGGTDTIIVNVNIVGVNDAPTITNSKPAAVTMSEDSSPTAFSLTLNATDADGDTITWSISSAATNGTATASGTGASKAIGYTPNSNYNGSDSFTVQVSDGNLGTDTIIVNVTINPVNDAPVVDLNGNGVGVNVAATFTEDTVGGAVLAGATDVTDVDNPNLTSATITLTNRPDGNLLESLSANTAGTSIVAAYAPATGVLLLSGVDTLANYQQVLRTVKYNNTDQDPDTTARIVDFKVNDGTVDSATAVATVTVVSVNDAPTNTVPGAQTVNEDTDLTFSGTISVADVDAGTNSVKVSLDVLNGTLTLASVVGLTFVDATANGTGSVHFTGTLTNINTALNGLKYRGNPNWNSTRGTETLTVVTNDQGNTGTPGAQSDTDNVGISVTAVSDNPVAATGKTFTAHTNMRINLTGLLTGASDPDDGDTNGTFSSTYTLTSVTPLSCTGCTITNVNSAGSFDFDPPAGGTGVFTVNYTITDTGNPSAGTSAPATVTITVSGPVIWFVDSSVAGPGDGRLSNPFKFLSGNAGVNNDADDVDAAGHRIFLYTGTHSTGIALNTDEWLIGQGATNSPINTFDALFGISPPAATMLRPSIGGTRPTVQNTVTLNANTSVRGLNIASTTNVGMADPGPSIAGVTVSEVAVTTTTATALALSNVTTSTFSFTGLTTTGGRGLDLTGTNTSSAFTFSSVSVSSGANTAFNATGGGTIEVCDELACNPAATGSLVNTLTTTSGIALNVNGTSITTNNLEFQSISATSGPSSGIVLNNTGTAAGNGGLVVKGNGSTCTFATQTCGGGSIQNATGVAVSLTSTKNVSLTRMKIQNSGTDGINATTVNGFLFDNGIVTDTTGISGQDGMAFTNMSGTVTISNSEINKAPHNGINFVNTDTNLAAFNLTNSRIVDQVAGVGNDGILFVAAGTSVITAATISNSTFLNILATAMQPQTQDTANMQNWTVTGSTFTTNNIGIDVGVSQSSDFNVTIGGPNAPDSNTFTFSALEPININSATTTTSAASLTAKIQRNHIGTQGVIDSGSRGLGIRIPIQGNSKGIVWVDNNDIHEVAVGDAMVAFSRNPVDATAPTAQFKFTNNTVQRPTGTTQDGCGVNTPCPGSSLSIQALNGKDACAIVSGNILFDPESWAASAGGSAIFMFEDSGPGSVLTLEGTNANANAQLAATNTITNSTAGGGNDIETFGLVSVVPAGTCGTFPSLLLAPGGVLSGLDSLLFPLSRAFVMPSAPCALQPNDFSFSRDGSANSASYAKLAAPPSNVSTSLNREQLDSIVSAAITRWKATGLTRQQIATLRGLKFEIADLQGEYLGEVDGNRILVDTNAEGKGWFVDPNALSDASFARAVSTTRLYTDPVSAPAGHVDLLTAIEHEMGHKLGLDDSYDERDRNNLMYGYLTVGERRLPASGQARNAKPGNNSRSHFLTLASSRSERTRSEASAINVAGKQRTPMAKALTTTSSMLPAAAPFPVPIGTIPAGKSVVVTFQVKLNPAPLSPPSTSQVLLQGTVSGSNFPSVQTDDTGIGANAGETDATVTPVIAPPIALDDPNYTGFKNTPLNIAAASGVTANDSLNTGAITSYGVLGTEQTTIGNPTPTAQGGTISLNANGSFSYTPAAAFLGADTFIYKLTNLAVGGTDTATVTITVANTSAIYVNEVLFNPPGTDAPNEYIELRGTANSTIPDGTYLIAVEGDSADNPGDVQTIINLSNLSFGTNGFLVLLQQGSGYTTAAGATVVTSTTTGFGGLPGGIWSADSAATDIEDASVTFMVIQTGVAPTLTNDIDSNDDATPDGGVYGGWAISDSIGALDGTATGDRAYGAMNYSNNTGTPGTASGTSVLTGFTAGYLGRRGNTTGSAAADWVSSGTLSGAAPNWTLGTAVETEPAGFAGKPLNHIGALNFSNVAPVNTVPGAQATNEDVPLVFTGLTQISIADADAGTASVQVTLTAVNGTMSLSGTSGLTFTPASAANDGTNDSQMIFTGTIANINTALNNLSFTPTLNYNGAASVTIETNDLGNTGGDGNKTDTDAVNITVGAVNDAPTLALLGNLTIAEDVTTQTVNLSGISAGPGESQGLSVTATSNNTGIIPNPSVSYTSPNGTGSISFTPVADANGGPVTITVTVMDDGGTLNGGANSFQRQFTVTVTEVNDAPVATDDTPPDVQEDSGANNIAISTLVGNDTKGAANETGQNLNITAVSNFVGGSATIVGPNVVFTPTANYNGPAGFDYTVEDDGTTNSLSDPKTDTGAVNFNITAVNDPPSFTKGADQTVNVDAGLQTVPGWATGMNQGPGESGQTPLTFNVVAQPGATVTFLVAPAIDSTTGNLTYTANTGSSGTATFDVTLSDTGASAPPPNNNTSAVQSFTITVVPTLALIVNDNGDAPDNNLGDKICDAKPAAGNQCTLRAAIQETNAASTPDSIGFDPSLNGSTIPLTSALPDINGDLVITGPAGGVTVSGANLYRVFTVLTGKIVSISNLTIANGQSNQGAGVFNSGNLTISNSTLTGNKAVGSEGGAIYSNSGTLTIINSTVSGNTSDGVGGGLANAGTSTASLTNVTITNNRADADGNAAGNGGGIHQSSSNSITLRNTMVAGNFVGASPGTTPDDVFGTVNAASNNNLIGTGGSGGLTNGGGTNNQVGVVDARLGALANNGGPTQTHALLSGSLALDAGDDSVTGLPLSLTTDQRGAGFARQADGPDANTTDTVDIGAFEADPSVEDISDKSTNEDTALPSFIFNVGDSSAAFTSIVSTSNNQTLVPDANILVGADTASTRTLSITPAANQFGTATITVTVTRGAQSMSDTFVLTVNGVNDPPSFTKGADQTVAEDSGAQSVSGWATSISQGPGNESGQTLQFVVQTNTNPGLFSAGPAISPTGTLTYTPAANANGSATITIVLMDNGGGSDTSGPQSFLITVTEVNDAPDAVNDPLTSVAEDSATRTISIASLLGNDNTGPANESGQTLTFALVAASEVGGTVTSDATNVYFTPAANFNGAASFQYTVTDNGTTNSIADPKNDTATVSFTITEVNDAPTAVNDTIPNSAEDSGPRTITAATLTGNDSKGPANESGQTLIIKTVGSPVGGTVAIVSGNAVFTPTADYNGPASFQYTVEDNGTTNGAADPLSSGPATVNFTITEVNDVPDAVNDGLSTVAEDSATRTIAIATLLANDSKGPANEAGQTLTLTGVSNPAGGTVTSDATNVYFTPAADFNGTATFQYTVTDNGTTNGSPDPKSDTATVSFTVTEVNDAPVPEDDGLGNMTENDPQRTIPFSLLTNNDSRGAANESGQTLIVKTVSNPVGLTVSIVGNTVRFTPLPNYSGPASFRYTVQDNGTTNGVADPKTSATSALVHFNITQSPAPGGVIRFSNGNYSVAEGAGFKAITVERSGDTSQAVTVDYASSDHSNPADFMPCTSPGAGLASSRCDFTTAIGTLRFAAGETSKTFNVLISQDNTVEGPETLELTLSNPTGGAVFGVPQTATLEIVDDVTEPAANPIDTSANFVIQQYHDVLNREPDAAGLAFWTDNIEKCNDPARRPAGQTVAECIDKQRESTAIAFFMSPEFQMTGGYVYHLFKGSLTGTPNYDGGSPGRFPTFLEFMKDMNQVSEGIVVNGQISGAVVEANRNALAAAFVQRAEFVAKYGGLNDTLYVQELFNTTGITPTAVEKQALVDGLGNGTETRASVLRKVVDGTVVISEGNVQFTTTYGQAFINQENNRLFVYLEYVGYLRRNPDAAGFVFWLGKLNQYNGDPFQAEMVESFIVSPEYRSRFGQP